MWSGIDKRRFPRAHFKCQVAIRRKDSSEKFLTQTENIGVGGICVMLEKGLELFSEVIVEVSFPDSSIPLVSEGKAVWVVKETGTHKRFDTGIEFVDLPSEERVRLEKVIENILRGVYKTSRI